MKFIEKQAGNYQVAIVESDEVVITDVQSVLDLLMTIQYETNCNRVILRKEQINKEFYDLKTRFAGEVAQKIVNYHLKLAIVGDFSEYTKESKSFRDYLFECNKGNDLFFLSTEKEALEKLGEI